MDEAKKDPDAPEMIHIVIADGNDVLFDDSAKSRTFASGSFGYNFSGKFTNKKSGEKYQVTCNVILIGSKPKVKA